MVLYGPPRSPLPPSEYAPNLKLDTEIVADRWSDEACWLTEIPRGYSLGTDCCVAATSLMTTRVPAV